MSIFPSQTNFVTGDILTATAVNEIGQAINLLDGAQTSGAKNRVLNSNMSVWQRGTSIACTSTAYTADRWNGYRTVAGGTVSRQVTGDTTNLPNIQYCARVQRDSGNTSTSQIILNQSFESVNSIPLAGKSVILSYYARAGANYSAASSVLVGVIQTGTGTDQNALAGYTGSAFASGNATLSTTWQRFTVSHTIPATATEVSVNFQFTPVGTAGANDYFEVTGVQLEAANTASPYAPNGATYQAELAACQRYYWRNTGQIYARVGLGIGNLTTQAQIVLNNPVQMRVAPTAIDYSTLGIYDQVTLINATNVTIDTAGALVTNVAVTVASGVTVYRPYVLYLGSASGYLGLSAEL
jgi:hypothetical protein